MNCYVGFGKNRLPNGQPMILETDMEALQYAMTRIGLVPETGWGEADTQTLSSYFDLEAFMSGSWDKYDDFEEYEEEREKKRDQECEYISPLDWGRPA